MCTVCTIGGAGSSVGLVAFAGTARRRWSSWVASWQERHYAASRIMPTPAVWQGDSRGTRSVVRGIIRPASRRVSSESVGRDQYGVQHSSAVLGGKRSFYA